MSFKEVYINNTSSFFPNEPVGNDEMEEYLGYINSAPSRSRPIVLRNNGIKRRFYALTKEGTSTHTNAQMTALAVKALFKNNPADIKSIELLSCGTSSPDQMMPFPWCNDSWLASRNKCYRSCFPIRSMLRRHACI
jgi:3-oxoacyl-[acyl-carrier-protein] synthase-3